MGDRIPELRPDAPEGLKRAVRWKRRYHHLALFTAAGTGAAIAISITKYPDAWIVAVVFPALFLPLTMICASKAWAMRRVCRARGGRLCGKCYQDLSGLGEFGACPECGAYFDSDADRWE